MCDLSPERSQYDQAGRSALERANRFYGPPHLKGRATPRTCKDDLPEVGPALTGTDLGCFGNEARAPPAGEKDIHPLLKHEEPVLKSDHIEEVHCQP